jgi:hypothetical protein
VHGTKVTFDVLTSTAGGVDDYCSSRSFALLLLADAIRRAAWSVPGDPNDPKRDAEVQRLYAKAKTTALHHALPPTDTSDWYVSEDWMRENVGRFVASCTLVERRNNVGAAELEKREQVIVERFGGQLFTNEAHRWKPVRWAECHNFTLEVVVTEPRWAEHLETGLEFGTTAFDVWYEG